MKKVHLQNLERVGWYKVGKAWQIISDPEKIELQH